MALSVFTYLRDADNRIPHLTDMAPSTALRVTSQTEGHPIMNLSELPISKVWRSADRAEQRIDIDLGTATEVNFVALVNHNLTASAQIVVTGASNDALDPLDADTVTMDMQRTPHNAWTLFDDAHSRMYWRVTLVDESNPDGWLQVGYLMIGRALSLPQNFQPGWGRSPVKIIRKTDSEISTPIIGRTVATGHRLDFEFLLDHADTDVLEDLLDSLDADPVFVVPDPGRRHGFFARIADPQNPWSTNVAVDNGPNQIEVSLLTDNEGTDI